MAGTNTEKPIGKAEAKKQSITKTPVNKKIETTPIKKKGEKKQIAKSEEEKIETAPLKSDSESKKEAKSEVKKEKKKKIEVKKIKKTSTFINVKNVPVSTKVAIAICKFIKKKPIEKAIEDLKAVGRLARAVPMKGEIPHRKGKMMSGRFPVRASKEFIILLKSLQGNVVQHDVEDPIVTEAFANKGTSVYGRGGRMKKRSNIKILCTQKKLIKKIKNKKHQDVPSKKERVVKA